jgi:arginase family enzyme
VETVGQQNILTIGSTVHLHSENGFPELEKGGVALIYVPEFRGVKNAPEIIHPECFRPFLYELFVGLDWKFPIYDLGNILPGNEPTDTAFALAQVIAELVKNKIFPVIIGGGQDLTVAMYKGYERLEQMVNICSVDYKLDLGSPEEEVHADAYLSHLLLQRPCYLFNYANIGLQSPFASKNELDLFEKLYFDHCRLGEFNADFRKAEPHLRNSDILSVDFRSIRASEVSSENFFYPNGFYADQVCQITKYAGISDKLTSMGIFNYYPEKNPGTTSALLAQMIWYLLDGIAQRKGDFPIGSKKNYFKFTVHVESVKEDLVFYRSNKSDRWWLEVSYPGQKGAAFDRHHLVPCDKEDYDRAMKNEIPDLWWKTYQKLI